MSSRVWWEADHTLSFLVLGLGLCVLSPLDQLPGEALSTAQRGAGGGRLEEAGVRSPGAPSGQCRSASLGHQGTAPAPAAAADPVSA